MLREHHWPADSTPVTHGHIVHLLAEEPEDEWTARDLQMQHVRIIRVNCYVITVVFGLSQINGEGN